MDLHHGIGKLLIFPWAVFAHQILIKSLSCDMEESAIKTDISFVCAVCCLERNKLHTFVFVDFRRLAAKKALASSRKSFSFFRRRISLSCALLGAQLYEFLMQAQGTLRCLRAAPKIQISKTLCACPCIHRVLGNSQLFGGFRLANFLRQLDCLFAAILTSPSPL